VYQLVYQLAAELATDNALTRQNSLDDRIPGDYTGGREIGVEEGLDMPTGLHPDSIEYARRFELVAAAQLRRHQADPLHVPMYLPADDPEFPSEAYTAGGPDEDY
jgi:hypothetical protein